MQFLRWVLRLIGFALLFLLFFGFAIKNNDPMVVHYFLGWEWRTTPILVMFVFFAVGAALGAMAGAASLYRRQREIVQLRRELRQRQTPNEPVLDVAREHRL